MSENELDRDYSYLEGKEIDVSAEGVDNTKAIVKNIEYNMGITILYKNNKICFCTKYGDLHYDKAFMAVVEMIEGGEFNQQFFNYINNIYADNGGINTMDAVPPENCAFYGG